MWLTCTHHSRVLDNRQTIKPVGSMHATFNKTIRMGFPLVYLSSFLCIDTITRKHLGPLKVRAEVTASRQKNSPSASEQLQSMGAWTRRTNINVPDDCYRHTKPLTRTTHKWLLTGIKSNSARSDLVLKANPMLPWPWAPEPESFDIRWVKWEKYGVSSYEEWLQKWDLMCAAHIHLKVSRVLA